MLCKVRFVVPKGESKRRYCTTCQAKLARAERERIATLEAEEEKQAEEAKKEEKESKAKTKKAK